MTTKVRMSKTGRITLPAEIRKAMDLEGEAEFLVEGSDDGFGIVLRPVVTVLRDGAWTYTAEDIESIERGLRDLREGRERVMTEAELRAMAEVAQE
ncbi:MAG TPA: AbrB/MazE/SpoVT family DNA-binding domain-containing protein [Tepidiformaceae bacterium]|nr:AbrB/MazE/SpoVT family DNA-binding domain-containing protein [Tepidiformaceae bacterium]HNO64817.1 AbrB/MazE/SpoVT family DNA-binding domain-containing protein [Tepidiformaceae bacterium]